MDLKKIVRESYDVIKARLTKFEKNISKILLLILYCVDLPEFISLDSEQSGVNPLVDMYWMTYQEGFNFIVVDTRKTNQKIKGNWLLWSPRMNIRLKIYEFWKDVKSCIQYFHKWLYFLNLIHLSNRTNQGCERANYKK